MTTETTPLPHPTEPPAPPPRRRPPWWAKTLLAPAIVAAITYGPEWWRLFFSG